MPLLVNPCHCSSTRATVRRPVPLFGATRAAARSGCKLLSSDRSRWQRRHFEHRGRCVWARPRAVSTGVTPRSPQREPVVVLCAAHAGIVYVCKDGAKTVARGQVLPLGGGGAGETRSSQRRSRRGTGCVRLCVASESTTWPGRRRRSTESCPRGGDSRRTEWVQPSNANHPVSSRRD